MLGLTAALCSSRRRVPPRRAPIRGYASCPPVGDVRTACIARTGNSGIARGTEIYASWSAIVRRGSRRRKKLNPVSTKTRQACHGSCYGSHELCFFGYHTVARKYAMARRNPTFYALATALLWPRCTAEYRFVRSWSRVKKKTSGMIYAYRIVTLTGAPQNWLSPVFRYPGTF